MPLLTIEEAKWGRGYRKSCLNCDISFISARPHTKTCSPKCRKALSRRSDLDKSKGSSIMRIDGIVYPAATMEFLEMLAKEHGIS